MRWTPIGVTVSVTSTVSGNGTLFIAASIASFQGQMVARVFNADTATQSFTLNDAAGDANDKAIPLSSGQDIVVSHSNVEIYINASSANIRVTPGTSHG
jgi:hypothetical protein